MKYNFLQFVAAMESDDFDVIDSVCLSHYTKTLGSYLTNTDVHNGDCTKQCNTCTLCFLESILVDYRQYTFDEDNWRKDNGIPPSKEKVSDDKLKVLGI